MVKIRILPTLTTIRPDWFRKIKEIKSLGLKEICLFPTCLKLDKRKKLYKELEKTSIKKIPFVHLRSDMELWELDYLADQYQTRVFNIHQSSRHPLENDLSKYEDRIYIENVHQSLDEKEIKRHAGVCIDFSHLERDRLFQPEVYQENLRIIKKYPCGCGHIASSRKGSGHFLLKLKEMNYLKKYQQYFPAIVAIELENSLKRQLEVKNYLEGQFDIYIK